MDTGAYMANQMDDLIESGIKIEEALYEGYTHNRYLFDEMGQFPGHKLVTEKLTVEQILERYGSVLSKEEVKRIKDFINPHLKYLETLPKAYEIHEQLFGEPKTHEEWAERFNTVGKINRILMDNGDK